MKTTIEIGHGNTLEIEDVEGKNPNKLVTVALKDAKGNKFGDGIAKMEDFKRLGKVMK